MQSGDNKLVLACAGSGKTTYIIEEALKTKTEKILITTYTNENLDQIKKYIIEKCGCIPPNVSINSWFSFLLQEGVRPYQNYLTDHNRTRSIFFQIKNKPFHKKDEYYTSLGDIYSNKVSEFVFECNKKSNGLVLKRLERIYRKFFIDELQDFAGYDLTLLELFFDSSLDIIAVGDPRQATFSTNNAPKNRQYRRSNIYLWLQEMGKKDNVIIEEQSRCFRCNQEICDFADALFTDLPKTTSLNHCVTGHDGIFNISPSEVDEYIKNYNPMVLRYSRRTDTLNYPALNIGLSKGRTYNRVLIFPTKQMLEYLKTKDLNKAGDRSKFYVALTRARYSVTFVLS